MSAHEQFENQQELARMQRRHHGAETAIDRALPRHKRITALAYHTRNVGPLVASFLFGWIGQFGMLGIAFPFAATFAAMVISSVVQWFFDVITESFVEPNHFFENVGWIICGLALIGIGFGVGQPGATIVGVFTLLIPLYWRRWYRHVYHNTEYSRLKRALEQPTPPPRIIE